MPRTKRDLERSIQSSEVLLHLLLPVLGVLVAFTYKALTGAVETDVWFSLSFLSSIFRTSLSISFPNGTLC